MTPQRNAGLDSWFSRGLAWLVLTTAAVAGAALLWRGASRGNALLGIAAAALGSVVFLLLMRASLRRSTRHLFGALTAALLVRMTLVAAGLVTTIRTGGDPIAFCIGFFGLYVAHQLVEIVLISRRARSEEEQEV